MNAQFHTPSFGDEDFDLSDCLPPVSGVNVGAGAGINFTNQQMQTKRVRNMETSNTTIDHYGSSSAHEAVGVYGTPALTTPASATDITNAQYIDYSGSASDGVGMTMNMGAPAVSNTANSMVARKQVHIVSSQAATSTATSSAATNSGGPAKPLSAYALFFQDTVSVVKPQNPDCSYHDLARIVSSMWETLDEKQRDVYNKKNEEACKEYLKNFRLYRQKEQQLQQQHLIQQQQQLQQEQQMQQEQQATNDSLTIQSKPSVYGVSASAGRVNANDEHNTTTAAEATTTATASNSNYNNQMTTVGQSQQQQQYIPQQDHNQHATYNNASAQQQQMACVNSTPNGIDSNASNSSISDGNAVANQLTMTNSSSTTSTDNATTTSIDHSSQQMQMLTEAGSVQQCTREDCNKRAIINPDWEDEYCSNECVVLHCRNVFNAWVKSNLEAQKTPNSAQNSVQNTT